LTALTSSSTALDSSSDSEDDEGLELERELPDESLFFFLLFLSFLFFFRFFEDFSVLNDWLASLS
jgi:hypothetical protein